jgi:hypothetical protein
MLVISSAESSDIYKYPKGSFLRLTTLNYAMWKGNIYCILQAILAWNIVDGTESIPPLTAPGATLAERAAAELKWTNYIQYHKDIVAIIYNIHSILSVFTSIILMIQMICS